MATLFMGSAPIYTKAPNHNLHLRRLQRFVRKSMIKMTSDETSIDLRRRSGNYQPSPLDCRYLLSIDNQYENENQVRTREMLKKKVKKMLDDVETKSRLEILELIDDLQKLGVSYHFDLEISNILTDIHLNNGDISRDRIQGRLHVRSRKYDKEKTLHATALEFRLLRQHGFDVSEDVFDVIIHNIEDDTFQSDDIESILSLYEASYLSTKLDTKLHKVIRPFAIQQIKKFVAKTNNIKAREKAIHALEMPYHWRMRRLETRWYIDSYEKKHYMNLSLIKFAKIDFNIVQTAHQEELKYITSWWKETCLPNQLHFARNNIVENYFWSVGLFYEPQFGNIRRMVTIIAALITTIDDIYDIYGTLEELELFTSMVECWNVNHLDKLPKYMRLCFLTLHNEINGIGCDILKSKNIDVIPYFKKSWADMCKSFLLEAKWYKGEYKPSLEEYIQNAWISIAAPTVLIHVYCAYSDQISNQILESLLQHRQEVIRCSSTVFRLVNDISTSTDEMARGDVLKSVQCYMYETGASEETASTHVKQMISDTWDEMNYEVKMAHTFSSLPRGFVEAAINLARMSQCMYQHGDGHGHPEKAKTVDRVKSLFFIPIILD